MSRKRNWIIEILRFLFAILIVVFHFNATRETKIQLGYHGNIGVEFFAILSGYLLAKKILFHDDTISTSKIVIQKIASFYWIWIIAIFSSALVSIMVSSDINVQNYVTDLFLLYGFGINNGYLGYGWYLSCMVISVGLLTPILAKINIRKKYNDDFMLLTFADLFLMSILFHTGKLSGVTDTIGIFPKAMLRFIFATLFGVIINYCVHNTKKYYSTCNEKNKFILNAMCVLLGIASLCGVMLYVNGFWPEKGWGEFLTTGAIGVLVFCSFLLECFKKNKATKHQKARDYFNKFCGYLGKLSLPIYIIHPQVQKLINVWFYSISENKRLFIIVVFSIIISAVILALKKLYDNQREQIKMIVKSTLAIVCCFFTVYTIYYSSLETLAVVDNGVKYEDKSSVAHFRTSTTLAEDFVANKDTMLIKVQFYTITWHKVFTDEQTLKIVIREKENQKELYSEVIKMSLFKDAKSYTHTIPRPIKLEEDKWYTVEFKAETSEDQEYMAMMMTNNTNNDDGAAYINGELTGEHISMKLWTKG